MHLKADRETAKQGGQGQQGNGNKSGGEGQQGKQVVRGNKNQSISPEELLAMYQDDPMWKQLSAVKNGHIYIVPDNVSPGKIGYWMHWMLCKINCSEAF